MTGNKLVWTPWRAHQEPGFHVLLLCALHGVERRRGRGRRRRRLLGRRLLGLLGVSRNRGLLQGRVRGRELRRHEEPAVVVGEVRIRAERRRLGGDGRAHASRTGSGHLVPARAASR